MKKILWLRNETKPFEERTPLTPQNAEKLLEKGVKVVVEKSSLRIFSDEEYEKAGCELVATNSWYDAPEDAIILGLKELPEEKVPLKHRHIFFAHAYKGQTGAEELLGRFKEGKGTILDLEYLVDTKGRRVAAFGYWAGFVGAGVTIDLYHHLEKNPGVAPPKVQSHKSQEAYVEYLKDKVKELSHVPKGIVVGYQGRCGQGATDLLSSLNLESTGWEREDTEKGGPFPQILEHDVFINCVLIQQPLPPFVTLDLVKQTQGRKLRIIADVSCDPTGPYNPVPLYDRITTCDNPLYDVKDCGESPLSIMAIDHLPSLLPRESSLEFSTSLFPHIESLLFDEELSYTWVQTKELFEKHLATV